MFNKAEWAKAYRQRKAKERLEYNRQWYNSNLEARAEYHQKYREDNREATKYVIRKNQLKKYGLTHEDYERMLKEQNGVCAMCNQTETSEHKSGTVKMLSVDHDHTTGKVRGLLCNMCNHSLGVYEKYKESCESYLNKIKGDA